MATSMLPTFPRLLVASSEIRTNTRLLMAMEYAINYLARWQDFDPYAKPLGLASYNEGDELELSGENRLNRLQWADELTTNGNFDDTYKVRFEIHEPDHQNRAVVRIVTWQDTNLDDSVQATENAISASTVIVEKRNY